MKNIQFKMLDFKDRYQFVLILSVLLLISLLLRMKNLDYVVNSLWAEDGNVFISQAAEFGFESIWMQYNGYMHLYPRVIAFINSFLPIEHAPFVYFTGWLIAFGVLIGVVFDRVIAHGGSYPVVILTAVIISLQPSGGEIYFSITNAQWFLGSALFIFLLVPGKGVSGSELTSNTTNNYMRSVFIMVMGLSGPFSILVLPALIVRFLLIKDFNKDKLVYFTVFICATIQVIYLLNSERVGSGEIDTDLSHWLAAFKIFFTFGDAKSVVKYLSLMFWLLLTYSLFDNYKKINIRASNNVKIAIILLFSALITYCAGLYAMKHIPHIINPLNNGSRYFFIPYTLIILSVIISTTHQKILRNLSIFLLCSICILSFQAINRTNLQFQAFSAFSKIKPSIWIPINPVWSVPFWYIKPMVSNADTGLRKNYLLDPEVIDLSKIEFINTSSHLEDKVLTLIPANGDPQLMLPLEVRCQGYKYIGIEIDIKRENKGWAQLFWNSGEGFSEEKSLKRYHPGGELLMYFAFKNDNEAKFLRIDPVEEVGNVSISGINMYCMD